jgi:microcin C transport system ATP-binding protein
VGHVKAVNARALAVRPGETLGIVGESGSGKTTLALAMLRLISSEGPVVFMGRDIQGLKSRELRDIRREMQIVFQDPYGSSAPHDDRADHRRGAGVHGVARPQPARRVAEIMQEVGLDRPRCTAIRTSFPADSGSASPSRAR